MLRQDVIDAVKAGKFHIWAVSTIDEGIHIITGMPMGEKIDGQVTEDTISFKVAAKLRQMAMKLKKYNGADTEADETKKDT